jgi:hypothetical protein
MTDVRPNGLRPPAAHRASVYPRAEAAGLKVWFPCGRPA